MTELIQPQNRERDLKAALDGYRSHIEHEEWFAEAFQKDVIQNSWDARSDKRHGNGWQCSVILNTQLGDQKCVVITDKGTRGLIGRIPSSQRNLLTILKDGQPSDRLAFFLSSQWSEHESGEGGSRGRGKMLLMAASEIHKFYFESLRSDDGRYIFGKVFLDEDKEIKIDFRLDKEAKSKFSEVFPSLSPISELGTRIFIPEPRKDLEKVLRKSGLVKYVSKTWWEILEKFKAQIEVGLDSSRYRINPSEWLPPQKILEPKNVKEYPPITVSPGLKIKRIILGFLRDKSIPEAYKGLHIQRAGMIVESIDIYNLVQEVWNDKIYGIVEFEPDLEEELKKHEGVEHYNFFWNQNPPRLIRQILKNKVLEFAKQHGLLEDNAKQAKEVKEAESNAEKILNKFAKDLNLKGLSRNSKNKKPHHREEDEKIRISIKDFDIPTSGRIDFGGSLNGAYAIPINDYDKPLNVLVTVYIYEKATGRNILSISEEKMVGAEIKEQERIGWEKISIEKTRFNRGAYVFRAKMVSLEDFDTSSVVIEKGQELYHPISRIFWIDQDPEEQGFFDVRRSDREEKGKFFWWRNEGSDKVDHYVLYWNGEHPVFKIVRDDKSALESDLIKFGSLAALSIAFSRAQQDKDSSHKMFSAEELRLQDFEEVLKRAVEKWGVFLGSR